MASWTKTVTPEDKELADTRRQLDATTYKLMQEAVCNMARAVAGTDLDTIGSASRRINEVKFTHKRATENLDTAREFFVYYHATHK